MSREQIAVSINKKRICRSSGAFIFIIFHFATNVSPLRGYLIFHHLPSTLLAAEQRHVNRF
jgi:hypothetical protein